MEINQKRYKVILSSFGGEIATEYSNHPWHPAKWQTYKGDVVSVFDRTEQEWYPDYVIDKDGE